MTSSNPIPPPPLEDSPFASIEQLAGFADQVTAKNVKDEEWCLEQLDPARPRTFFGKILTREESFAMWNMTSFGNIAHIIVHGTPRSQERAREMAKEWCEWAIRQRQQLQEQKEQQIQEPTN
jgi:hypothetical protein